MSPRWKFAVGSWWSYSMSERSAREEFAKREAEPGKPVLLIRRTDDRKGWMEIDRKDHVRDILKVVSP
jgi:predicted amidohydrolase YtcJ